MNVSQAEIADIVRRHAIIPGVFRSRCVCGFRITTPYAINYSNHVAAIIVNRLDD